MHAETEIFSDFCFSDRTYKRRRKERDRNCFFANDEWLATFCFDFQARRNVFVSGVDTNLYEPYTIL